MCVYMYVCESVYVYMGICVWVLYIRGVTNTQGGEYDTHHYYKATNTTIYS